jgi:transcription elongation factor GreA
MQIIPFTKIGFENLKKQLDDKLSQRPQAVLSLTRGREMGDLSENGLYKAAKAELSDLDRNIRNLRYLIKHARVYAPTTDEYVQLGHRVLLETKNGEKEYLMVGEYEANPSENKISLKSPIGHNLMGRKVNEEIKINTPNGINILKIIKIS